MSHLMKQLSQHLRWTYAAGSDSACYRSMRHLQLFIYMQAAAAPAAAAVCHAYTYYCEGALKHRNLQRLLRQGSPRSCCCCCCCFPFLSPDPQEPTSAISPMFYAAARLSTLLLLLPSPLPSPAGANMGDFTVFFAAAAGPSGAVYAFEPQARMYQLLCTNMIIK
jgi:hypothetical protein